MSNEAAGPVEAAKTAPEDQMIVRLIERPGSGLRVCSVNLFVDGMHTCLDGQGGNTIEAVFKPTMAEQVRAICRTATVPKQIINVPDYQLRLRGLSITGYTLMGTTLDDGTRRYVIQFRNAVGDALAVFHPLGRPGSGLTLFNGASAAGEPHGSGSERLFDEMLSQVYLPLVNLNSYLEDVLDGRRAPAPELMTASVLQFKTKAEVLKFAFDRLISESTPEGGGTASTAGRNLSN